jgi:hypothetical protein
MHLIGDASWQTGKGLELREHSIAEAQPVRLILMEAQPAIESAFEECVRLLRECQGSKQQLAPPRYPINIVQEQLDMGGQLLRLQSKHL